MPNNQQTLIAVIFALVVVIGFLSYDHYTYRHETVGEKVGHAIDDIGDSAHDAVRH